MSHDRYAVISRILEDSSVTYDVYDMDNEGCPEVVYEATGIRDAAEQCDSFNDQYANDRVVQPLLYDDCDDYDDSMDGDFDSAMASAGHGMDEDYE